MSSPFSSVLSPNQWPPFTSKADNLDCQEDSLGGGTFIDIVRFILRCDDDDDDDAIVRSILYGSVWLLSDSDSIRMVAIIGIISMFFAPTFAKVGKRPSGWESRNR